MTRTGWVSFPSFCLFAGWAGPSLLPGFSQSQGAGAALQLRLLVAGLRLWGTRAAEAGVPGSGAPALQLRHSDLVAAWRVGSSRSRDLTRPLLGQVDSLPLTQQGSPETVSKHLQSACSLTQQTATEACRTPSPQDSAAELRAESLLQWTSLPCVCLVGLWGPLKVSVTTDLPHMTRVWLGFSSQKYLEPYSFIVQDIGHSRQ